MLHTWIFALIYVGGLGWLGPAVDAAASDAAASDAAASDAAASAAAAPNPNRSELQRRFADLVPRDSKARDIQQAKALFRAAQEAEAGGRLLEALSFAEESFVAGANPKLLGLAGVLAEQLYAETQDVAYLFRARARLQQYLRELPKRDEFRAEVVARLATIQTILDALLLPEQEVVVTRLIVLAPVPGAIASIDGADVVELPIYRSIDPGEHRIRIFAEGYAEHEAAIRIPEGQSVQHDVDLKPLPARLSVNGPAGAVLTVDGLDRGVLPLDDLELEAGVHRVAVAKNGRTPFAVEITLARDEERTLDAGSSMRTSRQRNASWGLLGAGALGLVASGTLAGLAVRDQSAAETINERRLSTGITQDEQDRYDELRLRRDRLRSWSIGTGAVGLSALAVSSLMLAFDRPRIDAMTQYVREAPGPDGEPERALELSWNVTPTGALLSGSF